MVHPQIINASALLSWLCDACTAKVNRYLMHYKTLHITNFIFASDNKRNCASTHSKNGRVDLTDKCMATVAELWVLCDDTCTKWKAILIHSPSIALAGSTTSKLCKTPKKNNPTSSLPAAKRNIIFHRRKSRNKIANKMQKARSDDPEKLQSDQGWCASPNAHTGAKGFFWHTRFTYFLNAWHNLWMI